MIACADICSTGAVCAALSQSFHLKPNKSVDSTIDEHCLRWALCVLSLSLSNIPIGNLVGGFASYFTPDSTTTKGEFQKTLNTQTLCTLRDWLSMLIH